MGTSMKKCLGEVHNLKLIRNNNQAQECCFDWSDDLGDGNHKNIFFMLDYFDFMEQTELVEEQQGYIAFSDMIQDINHKSGLGLSSKIMGLYQIKGEGECGNSQKKTIFSLCNRNDTGQCKSLSSRPFLGIVQIFICDYQFTWNRCGIEQIDDILSGYEKRITDTVDHKIQQDEEKYAGAEYSLYRSIASSDFCLVIKSSYLTQIYEIVSEILNISEAYDDNSSGNVRMFNTYTNIGIECVKGTNNYLTFSNDTITKNENSKFAIRFSFNDDFNIQLTQLKNICGSNIDVVNGLFGRYDAVVRIQMSEFAKLYPFLCKNKMGEGFTESEKEEIQQLFPREEERLVRQLVEGIVNGKLRAVNERALLGIGECEFNDNTQHACINNEQTRFVKEKNDEIRKKYKEINLKYKENFLNRKTAFLNIYHLLGKVIEAYETLGYEQDTHINWYICMEYFQDFFRKIENLLEKMEDNDAEREKILRELRDYVKAMNEYTRLLQSVNQHTIQSPQYDVLAPMDAEKFLIAYSEYMHCLDKKHYGYNWKNRENICKEDREKCSVVIYPEMTKGKLELKEVITRDDIVRQKKDRSLPSLLICTLPSFEYFERPYDMIPLISHEMFHHVLVLKREERNWFLIEKIMETVFKHICYKMNMEAMGNLLFVKYSYLNDLFAYEFSKQFLEKYKEENHQWENYLMTHIGTSVILFLQDILGQRQKFNESAGVKSYNYDYYNYKLHSLDGKNDTFRFLLSMVRMEYSREESNRIIAAINEVLGVLENVENENDEKIRSGTVISCQIQFEKIINGLINKCSEVIDEKYRVSYDEIKNISDKERDRLICKKMEITCTEISGEQTNLLKDYYEKIRMIHKNMFRIRNYIDFCTQRNYRYTDILTVIVKNLQEIISKEYMNVKNSKYYIYGQEEVSILNYWNMLMERPEAAVEQIQVFLHREAREEYRDIVKREIIFYRETCADIFMCRNMKMKSFGYLRMIVSIWGRMGGYENEICSGFVNLERIKNVLALLLADEGGESGLEEWMGWYYRKISVQGLYAKIEEYMNNSLKQTMMRMERMMKKNDNEKIIEQMEDYFKRMELALQRMFFYMKNGKKVTAKGCPIEELYMNNDEQFSKKSKLKRYLQNDINVFLRIIYILQVVSECQQDGYIIIEEKVYQHYRMIYENPKSEDGKKSDLFEGELHETVKQVADFYNNPGSEGSEGTSNRDKLNQMLQFVQDYYYFNRIRKTGEEAEVLKNRKGGE